MLPARHFDLARFHAQRLLEGHGLEVIDFYFRGQRNDLAQLIDLAHGFVEDGGDNAAVAVSGRAGVALAEPEAADEARALLIVDKAQAHAVGVIRAAREAVILLQLDVAGVVSGLGGAVLGWSFAGLSIFGTRRLGLLSSHREILS